MCGHGFSTYAVQSHHVYPKALYPEKAYDLENAAILCTACHIDVVHSGNATVDLNRLDHWKEFVVFFNRQNKLVYRKRFNEANQHRV